MEEIWKPVEGYIDGFYDGLYEVSNFGRFKQLPRRLNCRGGSRMTVEKIVYGSNSNGYRTISFKKDRISFQIDIHILVAKAFIPNPENKYSVNHKDANRSNNHVDNLEWATQKEQLEHAKKLGLLKITKGESRSTHKLTESQVVEMRELYENTKTSYRKLGKRYNISGTTVRYIISRKKWKHVEETFVPNTANKYSNRIKHGVKSSGLGVTKGENRFNSKLTDEQVREMRELYATTQTSYRKLAKKYNVGNTVVKGIIDKTRWKHVV